MILLVQVLRMLPNIAALMQAAPTVTQVPTRLVLIWE